MKVLGITGGVGAGKSTVLMYLKEHYGARVIQADQVGHLLQQPHESCYRRIVELFGTTVLNADGTISRPKLGAIVYADPQKMAEKMKKIAKNEDNYLLVAENTENGDLCGSLIGVVFEDICDTCKPILLVENVVTDEKYRGKGIGRGMFEAVEAWGKEKECHYCILVSGLQRTGAHKFYDAIGYSEVKGFKKYL